MKIFIFISVLFACTFSWAQNTGPNTEDPSKFCDNIACSDPMKQVSQKYAEGNSQFALESLSAYSGSCYHIYPNLDPNDAHYGVYAFKNEAGTFSVNGFFGFFYNDDPYANSSASQVWDDLSQKGYKSSVGAIRTDHAELSFVTAKTNIQYWYRNSLDMKKLYLIGRWQGEGWGTFMFCDLNQR